MKKSRILLSSILISLNLASMTALGSTVNVSIPMGPSNTSNTSNTSNPSSNAGKVFLTSSPLFTDKDIEGTTISTEEAQTLYRGIFSSLDKIRSGSMNMVFTIHNGYIESQMIVGGGMDLNEKKYMTHISFNPKEKYETIFTDGSSYSKSHISQNKWKKDDSDGVDYFALIENGFKKVSEDSNTVTFPSFLEGRKASDGSYIFYTPEEIASQDILKYIDTLPKSYTEGSPVIDAVKSMNISALKIIIKTDEKGIINNFKLQGKVTNNGPTLIYRIETDFKDIDSYKVILPSGLLETINNASSNTSKPTSNSSNSSNTAN